MTEISRQKHEQLSEDTCQDRTPEFEALMEEYFDCQAMILVPTATTPAEAWAHIEFHNLFDRLQYN